jgi:hypothetical protein
LTDSANSSADSTPDLKPVYRMSGAGYCSRAIGAARLGFTPLSKSTMIKTILEESSKQEELVVDSLMQEGYTITDRQRELAIKSSLFSLVGHIDGCASIGDSKWVAEIKALGRATFKTFKSQGINAFPQYKVQVSCYSHAIGLPILFCVKCRDTGELVKTIIEEPPVPLEDILGKIAWIEICAKKDELPDPDEGHDCFMCDFRYLCSQKMGKGSADLLAATRGQIARPEMNQIELETAADLWREAKALERRAEELMERARDSFKEQARLSPKFSVSGLNVTMSTRSRETLDKKKLFEMFGEESVQPAISRKEYEELRVTDTTNGEDNLPHSKKPTQE